MHYVIFYSWQSDINGKLNRNLIRRAIDTARKRIERERNVKIFLDEATRNEIGSVHIAQSIEKKIRDADIFICDISIINAKTRARKTPNPNVLYELGIASETVNWDHTILINNLGKGKHEDLPFDIKFRRSIGYKLSEHHLYKPALVKQERDELSDNIYLALRALPFIKPKLRLREIIERLNGTKWNAHNFDNGQIQPEVKGNVFIELEFNNIFKLRFESFENGSRFVHGDWEARFFINQETLTTADLAFRSSVDFGFKN